MRFSTLKVFWLSLAIGFSVSCQRTWHAKPALQQQTALGVNASLTADAQAEKIIAPYKAQLTKKIAEVIGHAPLTIPKLHVESPAGNFVADLQRMQAEKITGQAVDIGLITAGGVRTSVRQGNITVGHVYELMPFENELLVITVSGKAVKQLLDYATKPQIYANAAKVVSTSNVSYQILNNRPQHIQIGGQPLDSTRNYTIAVSDYLANGGDNLDFLKQAVNRKNTGVLVRDAIMKHIKELTAEGKPVEAKADGRVQIILPALVQPVSTPENQKL